jgi:Flp pilus assembly protein TadD
MSPIAALVMMLAGCASHDDSSTITGAIDVEKGGTRQSLLLDDQRQGREHFSEGRYGLAEQHFRKAVEAYPGDAAAWTGLAASYDQLGRFDLAARAYDRAMKLDGRSPALLNNLGYHYMLQGHHGRARQNFQAAAQLAPEDNRIRANLVVLDTGQLPNRQP